MSRALPTDAAERIRSAVLLQVGAALRRLEASRAATDADVHESRKAVQRARGMLRLLRFSMTPRAFAGINRVLRDAGRALSGARDARVIRSTLANIVARERIPAARARRLRARLDATSPTPGAGGALRPRDAAAARALLVSAHRRVVRLTLAVDATERLSEGLARIRRRGRKAMLAAQQAPTPTALHEWRKHVKNYWHALEALPPRGTRRVRDRIAAARTVSKLLGVDHDLALLDARLRDPSGPPLPPALVDAIGRRRASRQRRAFRVGRTLYGRRGS
jgi:CHAD domain-containing protein